MSVPSNNVIPPHPGVAAAAAAAGPAVRVASDNNMIPGNPAIAAQIAAARNAVPGAPPPQNLGEDFSGDPDDTPNPQADWFAAAATGRPTPEISAAPAAIPPVAPPAAPGQPQQTQQPTYSEIDALLEGIQLPGQSTVQPQAQPQAAQPQVVQPQEPQVPQVVQPQAPAPQAPGAAPARFDAEAAQKAAIDQLMGREYALSEVDQRKLIAEPETVIPRLAAQVHVNVVRDIGARFGQIVPQIVSQLVEQQLVGVRREAEFFARYPKLAHPALREDVTQSLAMVKSANPNITQEQLFTEGAAYAAFRIRQKYRTQAMQPQMGAPQPQMRAPQPPFVPMSPGAPSVPMSPQPSNPFAELAAATDLFDW